MLATAKNSECARVLTKAHESFRDPRPLLPLRWRRHWERILLFPLPVKSWVGGRGEGELKLRSTECLANTEVLRPCETKSPSGKKLTKGSWKTRGKANEGQGEDGYSEESVVNILLVTMFPFAVAWAGGVREKPIETAVALPDFVVMIAHQPGPGVPVEMPSTSAVLRVAIAAQARAEVAPAWSAITTGDSPEGAGTSRGTRGLVGRQARSSIIPGLLPSVPTPPVPREAVGGEG